MADGTDELVHALTRLLSEMIREATRLSIEMADRRAHRLRQAAQAGERAARAERTRVAAHRAADAAIWRRTADPVWWRKATPEQMAKAWRAANTWHQVDPEAAGARQAMADRLRRRGVEVDTDRTANPGDARWLQTALDLAQAEREEQAAFAAERDSDVAELAEELLWDADELPRTDPESRAEAPRGQRATGETTLTAGEVLWNADELATQNAAGVSALTGEVVPGVHAEQAVNGHTVPALTRAPHREAAQPEVVEGIVVSAVATEPNTPRRNSDVDLERMVAMLRSAWSSDKADRVLDDAAWPALASTMQRLDKGGKDVPKLLRDLPIDTTTDVKVPAMLTAWTLRAAAAGPASLRRAVRTREQHLQRTAAARDAAAPEPQDPSRDEDNTVVRTPADVDPSVATLLATAFPTTTKQALNRKASTADTADRPGAARDRAVGREPVTADRAL